MRISKVNTVCRATTVAVFLLLLVAPTVDSLFDVDPTGELIEKRETAPFPQAPYDRTWPDRFESWFNDRFGFRRALVKLDTVIKVLGLGQSTVDWISIGREGWLFLRQPQQVKDYHRQVVLTADELQRWKRGLEGRRKWLADQGIHYLFVVSPDKARIYPEMMEPKLRPRPGPSRLAQLKSYLEAHSTFRIHDPAAALLANKHRGQLYFRTDSHWNQSGAWIAYRELVRESARFLPDLRPHPITAFLSGPMLHGGDLVLALGLKGLIKERTVGVAPNYEPRPKLLPGCTMPCTWERGIGTVTVLEGGNTDHRLMMFHDSFGEFLIYNLASHFAFSCFSWQNAKDPREFRKYIVASKPNLVIEQRVERNLHQIPEWVDK